MADPNECERESPTSVNGGDATATVSPLWDWVDQIIDELQNPVSVNGGDARATATIFRVPIPIREVAVESYIPKLFSFGLYGHDTITDRSLDEYRLDFVRIFMNITGKSWDEVVDVVEVDGDSVEDWVKLYGDYKLEDQSTDRRPSMRKIKNLLALDSVFIACFIQAYHQQVCRNTGEASCPALNLLNQEREKVGFRPLVHLIILDIFKFENQIPLRLLEKYVEMMFEGTDTSGIREKDPFTKFLMDAVDLIYCDLPGPPTRNERFRPPKISEGLKQCKNLLHCLYSVVCYKPDPAKEGPAGTSESMWNRILECLPAMPNTGDGRRSARGQGEVELSQLRDGQTANVNLPTGQDVVAGGAPETLPGHNVDTAANHPQCSSAGAAGQSRRVGAVTAAGEPAHRAQVPAPPGTGACNDQDVVPGAAPETRPREFHAVDLRACLRKNLPRFCTGDDDVTAAEETAHGAEETKSGVEGTVPPGTSASNLVMLQLTSILKACWTFIFKDRPSHTIHIPTVTQLKEAGIRVAVGNTTWISEVHFKRSFFQGILYIPAFSVYDETEVLLRNLLTFEYVVEKKRDLRSYVHLMVNLINTEEDVKLMRESRVLKNNSLGSDKLLANMWNKMLSRIVITLSNHYLKEFHLISGHYDNSFNKLTGEVFGLYFRRKPWLFLGGGLVLATAVATILSTVYTILTYKITPNH